MELVTITCSRDFDSMRLQANSIDRFIEIPCTHYVVVEDTELPLEEWRKKLQPFYTRHTLVLSQGEVELQRSGWVRQQVLKLSAAAAVNTEYSLILDSKNFFIKPVRLDQWPINEGSGIIIDTPALCVKWGNWIEHLSQITGIEIPDTFWKMGPPFRIKTSSVQQLCKQLDVEDVFAFPDPMVSEFILYRFFSDAIPTYEESIRYIFRVSRQLIDYDEIDEMIKIPSMRVLSLHMKCVATQHPRLQILKQWLLNRGYDATVVNDLLP